MGPTHVDYILPIEITKACFLSMHDLTKVSPWIREISAYAASYLVDWYLTYPQIENGHRSWYLQEQVLTWVACKLYYELAILCGSTYLLYPLTIRHMSHMVYSRHYNDVIMITMASQISSITIVYSPVYSDANQRNIKAPRHWPLWWEFTGDRWIPRTNGQ